MFRINYIGITYPAFQSSKRKSEFSLVINRKKTKSSDMDEDNDRGLQSLKKDIRIGSSTVYYKNNSEKQGYTEKIQSPPHAINISIDTASLIIIQGPMNRSLPCYSFSSNTT